MLAEVDAALAEIDAEVLFDLDQAERTELRALLGRLDGVSLGAAPLIEDDPPGR